MQIVQLNMQIENIETSNLEILLDKLKINKTHVYTKCLLVAKYFLTFAAGD